MDRIEQYCYKYICKDNKKSIYEEHNCILSDDNTL
jgi:secreted PhoX family phosphatase